MTTLNIFRGSKPVNPRPGDTYIDYNTYCVHVWTGTEWVSNGSVEEVPFTPPTKAQLEKHPALKAAWDEFMIVKRLLGI